MIVSQQVRLAFAGNGTTTTFPLTGVSVQSMDDYVVELQTGTGEPVLLTPGLEYTITGTFPGEGTLQMFTAPAVGQTLWVRRSTPSTQEMDLAANAKLRAQQLEEALDKLTRRVQELEERLLLTPRVPYHEALPGTDPGLALPLPQTGHILLGQTGVGWRSVDLSQQLSDMGYVPGGGGGGGGDLAFPLRAPAGSESSPSYSWQMDPDSGLVWNENYQIFVKDGAPIARLGDLIELGMQGFGDGFLRIFGQVRNTGLRLDMTDHPGSEPGLPDITLSVQSNTAASGSLSLVPLGTGRVLLGGDGGLGTDLTAPPFLAHWNGGDLATAVAAAVAAGKRALYVPPGDYVWNSAVEVPTWFRLIGAGPTVTRIRVFNPVGNWLTFKLNTDTAYDTDWCKGQLSGFRIDHFFGSGILVEGHEVTLDNLMFHGGVVGEYAIDFLNCNESFASRIWIGRGGGSLDWLGNGIRLRLNRGTSDGKAVNFGDGAFRDIHIKLKSANSVGFWIDGAGFEPTSGTGKPLINNVLFEAITISAGSKPANSIGMFLRQVARCTFVNIDIELLEVGFKLRSRYMSGNAGSNQYNTFVGCYVLNCTSEWLDVGDTEDGGATPATALRSNFIGCFFCGPGGNVAAPDYGFQNNDENGNFTARRSPVDLVFGGTTWYTLPSTGQVQTGLRCSQQGRFLIVGDINYTPAAGSAPYDGMPKNDKPRKAICFDFGVNETRIFRPWGTAEGTDARLTIGNGFMSNPSGNGTPPSPLHHVKIADPLYLERWPANTALPSGGSIPGYGSNVPDIMLNVSDITPLGTVEDYQGPGIYSKHGRSGAWLPVVSRPGWMKGHLSRSGTSYTLTASDAGKILEHTPGSGLATVTVNAGLIGDDEATNQAGRVTSFWFIVKNRSGAGHDVRLDAGSGVSIFTTTGTTSVSQYDVTPGKAVLCVYSRTGSGTARVDVLPFA